MRDWYVRCFFYGPQTGRPEHLRLDASEKKQLAEKLLLFANRPLQPFTKTFEEIDDHVLFLCWNFLNDKERLVFTYLLDNEKKGLGRPSYC